MADIKYLGSSGTSKGVVTKEYVDSKSDTAEANAKAYAEDLFNSLQDAEVRYF